MRQKMTYLWAGTLAALMVCFIFTPWAQPQTSGQDKRQTAPIGAETYNVHLRIVPFYAIDKHGNPVMDLTADEVEIRVDGKPVKIEYFDRYIFNEDNPPPAHAPQGPQPTAREQLTIANNRTPRHIFIVFDLAFSSHRGYRRARQLALKLAGHLLDSDRVYLLVFGGLRGLRQVWGPLRGKEKVRVELAKSLGLWRSIEKPPRPDVDTLVAQDSQRNTPPSADLPDIAEFGRVSEQPLQRTPANIGGVANETADSRQITPDFGDLVYDTKNFNRWTYHETAEKLAKAFLNMANFLKPIAGPKVMILFSQGVQNSIYFGSQYAHTSENPSGFDLATIGPFGQDDRLGTSFLHKLFSQAMKELTDAGVMTMFINSEGGLKTSDRATGGENALRHMARTTDGVYLGGSDLKVLEDHVVRWTSAYYEASFFLRNKSLKGKRHKVQVKIKRPGVKLWSLKSIRDPRAYRYFSDVEKELYALQLIYQGPLNLNLRPANAVWYDLPGQPEGAINEKERILTYRMDWPPEFEKDKVEVFSIVLFADNQRRVGKPFQIRKTRFKHARTELVVQARLPWNGAFVWGIVAVGEKSGITFWRRWFIPSPLEQLGKR